MPSVVSANTWVESTQTLAIFIFLLAKIRKKGNKFQEKVQKNSPTS
jgi:hypothetical protein